MCPGVDDHDDGPGLDFPCEFPIKVFGRDQSGFRALALKLIEAHTGKIPPEAVQRASSRNGRFVSLTITITAQSRPQLDRIYQALSDSPDVLIAL